jgi:hypothetical protein
LEVALDGVSSDDLGDVQPWQRRSRFEVWERLVDGVVGADEKIGTDLCKLVGGGEHEFGYSAPVVAVDVFHVLGEGVRVHRDFGMIVWAQELRAFDADGSIAESCAFGGAGDDADVL